MKDIRNRIAEIKTQGYSMAFGPTFDRTLAVYKSIAMPGGVAFLLFGMLYLIMMSLTTSSTIDMGRITPDMDFQQMMNEIRFQLENQTLQQKITDAASRIVMGVLSVPLMAGLIRLCRDAESGQGANLGTVFQYFKGHYFSDLFVAGLLINLFTFALGLGAEYMLEISVAAAAALMVLTVAVSVLTTLFVPFIVLGDLPPLEAIGASITVVGKKFGTIFLLLLTSGIMALFGLLACCVGVVFTLPIIAACQYAVYAQSVGVTNTHGPG